MQQRGFTLVELLIALAIFAVLSVLTASALHHSLFAYDKIKQHQRQLQKLNLTEQLLRNDVAQLQARPVIDINGKKLAALDQPHATTLDLTTASRANPQALFERSSLQRVRYQLKNHDLLRITWPTLDGFSDKTEQIEVLLNQVNALKFTFIDNKGRSYTEWHMSAELGPVALPAGICVDITWADKREFHGDFAVFYQKQGANG